MLEYRKQDRETLFSHLDDFLGRVQATLFGRHRLTTVLAAVAIYLLGMLTLGPRLAVSSNYLVILPILCISVAYGLTAGIVSGAFGLPANLLIFTVLGHTSFSPASKLMAELSGVMVGTAFGYLSDYYRKLEAERLVRQEKEDELRQALRDKEVLFREVHHRVKNNLNLVKSIIGLQSRRSGDPAFKEAAEELSRRIMTISMIHERLYRTAELSSIAIDEYLSEVVKAVIMSVAAPAGESAPVLDMAFTRKNVSMDIAVPLGLIVNETVTNAVKHARPENGRLRVSVYLMREGEDMALEVTDNGCGFEGLAEGQSLDIYSVANGSMGLTLIKLLTDQLCGRGRISRTGGQTRIKLAFPLPARE